MLASFLKFYLGITPVPAVFATAIIATVCSALLPSTQDPHSDRFAQWVETAPPGIQRLIDSGQVRFETNDQELAARKKQGLTKFKFNYDYRYRLTKVRRIESTPPAIAVTANIQLAEIGWTHQIVLMKSYQPAEPWKSRLLQHEFDHVSISTDPRLKILAKECLGARIEFELPASVPASEDSKAAPAAPLATRIERQIQTLMEQRAKEIERITQALNDRFDRESKDGVQHIHTREMFFADFFTPDTLRTLDFQFSKLLENYASACRRAPWKEHYTLNAPY